MTENNTSIREKGLEAKEAGRRLAALPYETRQNALREIERQLRHTTFPSSRFHRPESGAYD